MHAYQGSSVSVAATAASIAGVITMPAGANGLHIANTSTTLYVTVRWSVGATAAVLGTSPTIPPNGQLVVDTNDKITDVAAIGSAAGPTAVIFTPVHTEG